MGSPATPLLGIGDRDGKMRKGGKFASPACTLFKKNKGERFSQEQFYINPEDGVQNPYLDVKDGRT